MTHKIVVALCLPLLLSCSNSDSSSEEGMLSCSGYDSPTLTVTVQNSLSRENIVSAEVLIYNTNSSTMLGAGQYDSVEENFFSNSRFLDSNDTPFLGVVVSGVNYHTYVDREMGFTVNANCGNKNDWALSVYLCPLDSNCL